MKICRKLWPFGATRDRQSKWKKGAQGIGKPPKMIEKNTFLGHFFMFFGVRGPFGSRRVSGPGKVPKMFCFRSQLRLVFEPFWHFAVSC